MAKMGPTTMAIKVPVPIVTVCLGLFAPGTMVGLDSAGVIVLVPVLIPMLVPVATASLSRLVKVLMNVLICVVLCSVAVIAIVYVLVYKEYIAVLTDGGGVYLLAEVVVVVVSIPVVIVTCVPGHVAVECMPSEILPQTVVTASDGPFWHSARYIQVVSNPVFQP